MLSTNSVWMITGASRGLGRALAEEVLTAGYKVVLAARRRDEVGDLVVRAGDRAMAVALDVTDKRQVAGAVEEATARFGRVDVLVNNAGYGYLGAIEEGVDEDVRALFDTNLFGQIDVIKAILPGMRARRSGHIVNVSSIGGIVTYPGLGYYHMVKFGVEAMSDTLAKELWPLGIAVTVVAPGAFRTDFRGPHSIRQAATVIDDYADTAGKTRAGTQAGHGKQPGDPVRGARAIIKAVEAERPPVHLLIGGDALDQLRTKLADMRAETDAWEETTRSTDFVAKPAL